MASISKIIEDIPPTEVATVNAPVDMPTIAGERAQELVCCGPFGTTMHDDRHLAFHYSVLYVVHGDYEWVIRQWNPKTAEVLEFMAGKGQCILLNTHQPHSLTHANGQHAAGWAAAAWNFNTKHAASKMHYKISG